MHVDTDFLIRLGQFRKELNAEGLHGHYNLFQTWFGEEADQGDEAIRETRRKALVDAARAVCGGCAAAGWVAIRLARARNVQERNNCLRCIDFLISDLVCRFSHGSGKPLT